MGRKQTTECPACGMAVDPDARFCRSCGTSLGERTKGGTTEATPPAGTVAGSGVPLRSVVVILAVVVAVLLVAVAVIVTGSNGDADGGGQTAGDGDGRAPAATPAPAAELLRPGVAIDPDTASRVSAVADPVELPDDEFDLGAEVNGLAQIDDLTVVAVGSGDTIDSLDPTVWRSEDGGQTWTSQFVSADPAASEVMADVAVLSDGRLVAVGGEQLIDLGTAQRAPGTALVWTSDDGGVTWSEPQRLPGDLGSTQGLSSVAVGSEDQLVAVGQAGDGDVNEGAAAAAAFWVSDDRGETWVGTSIGEGEQRAASVNSVAFDGAQYVAVGSDDLNLFDTDAADEATVWISADGREWETAPPPQLEQTASLDAIVWLDGGFLATGGRTGAVSADGRTWRPIAFEGILTEELSEASPGHVITDGAVVGDRLLFGGRIAFEDGSDSAVYTIDVT